MLYPNITNSWGLQLIDQRVNKIDVSIEENYCIKVLKNDFCTNSEDNLQLVRVDNSVLLLFRFLQKKQTRRLFQHYRCQIQIHKCVDLTPKLHGALRKDQIWLLADPEQGVYNSYSSIINIRDIYATTQRNHAQNNLALD